MNATPLFLIGGIALLNACTTLPRPTIEAASPEADAVALVERSAEASGDPWARLREVTVAYDGEWSRLAESVQPVLVDSAYRKSSTETYRPAAEEVVQVHTGPAGNKRVTRRPGFIEVTRDGVTDTDPESRAAAALVADAYTLFTFGSSALKARAGSWSIIGQKNLAEEPCTLVQGLLRPGLGPSEADAVIAWIGDRTARLHRLQFTLNGLESTAGADVDVTFSDFRPGPFGTEWPHHFLERIRRPINAKAHEWRLVSLKAEAAR